MGLEVNDNSGSGSIRPAGYSSKKPHPIDIHVGSRVRLQRVVIGMSQQKLGDLLGLTFQQVQKYEKGINRIGASRLFEVSQIFSVPVQFFFDELNISEGIAANSGFAEGTSELNYTEFLNTREGIELNRAFQQIKDPKDRRNVVELVRALANKQAD